MIKMLIFTRRLYFSPRFYLYTLFAVLLDFSMTMIGVEVLGYQAEKNPYIYNHMINGTIWSHFIPELIMLLMLMMIFTSVVSACFLQTTVIEIEKEKDEKIKRFLKYTTIFLFAWWMLTPSEFFAQGVLWTISIIFQVDIGAWLHPLLIDPILLFLWFSYIIGGIALLVNESEGLTKNECA